jgi:serine/threonine protein kinase
MDKSVQWTCGKDRKLECRRLINSGAYGDVYEVHNDRLPFTDLIQMSYKAKTVLGYPVKSPTDGKVFARKIMRVIRANEEDVENERRAFDVLLRNGHHDNIVHILKHGFLGTAGQVYFIDMELADLSLDDYIKYVFRDGPLPSHCTNLSTFMYHKDSSKLDRLQATCVISCQIAKGLEYMHLHGECHRDLKPPNGIFIFCLTGF